MCCQFGNGSAPYPEWQRAVCDELLGPQVFRAIRADLKTIGGGAMLTEFGECVPDGETS